MTADEIVLKNSKIKKKTLTPLVAFQHRAASVKRAPMYRAVVQVQIVPYDGRPSAAVRDVADVREDGVSVVRHVGHLCTEQTRSFFFSFYRRFSCHDLVIKIINDKHKTAL